MARRVSRGEIWGYRFAAPDKWHPVLVLSCQDVIGLLHAVTAPPITSSIRGAPSEILVGNEGLKKDSAMNIDHVQTVKQACLERFIGRLTAAKMQEVSRALAIAVGCDEYPPL